jgi:hypothetical protein
MKTSTQSALIVASFFILPILVATLLIILSDFINIIIVVVTFCLCFGLVAYYSYIQIKEGLDWIKSEDERLTYNFRHDAEKIKLYKFYKKYFDTNHEK